MLKQGRNMMKKALWILFIAAALIWTAFAFAAAGLARWTSDAIAAEPSNNSSWTQTTKTMTTSVIAPVNEVVSSATAALNTLGANVSANVPPLPTLPAMPPVPAWVDQWLGPEWTQSLREWGAWAKAAAGVGAPAAANAPNAPNAASTPSATTTASAATTTSEAINNNASAVTETASAKAAQLAEQARASAVAASPWLASIIGWLVPIVWVIWGVGLLVGFVATLVLQGIIGRFMGGGSNRPTGSFS
jgi:hypothetical protein